MSSRGWGVNSRLLDAQHLFEIRILSLNPLEEPGDWTGRACRGSGGVRVWRKHSLARRFGSYLAVGELQPVGQLSQGTIHVWIDISVESPWNPANGRLFCYMNIQEWVRVKLLLSLWCYRNNSFGFYILKKSKLPLDMWGQIFNLEVTLIRDIQFKTL